MHKQHALTNARDLAHDFSVKLMCSTLAALAGEMAGICDTYIGLSPYMRYLIWLKQSTVTNPAVCHDKVVNQQFAACSGSPHDDESSH